MKHQMWRKILRLFLSKWVWILKNRREGAVTEMNGYYQNSIASDFSMEGMSKHCPLFHLKTYIALIYVIACSTHYLPTWRVCSHFYLQITVYFTTDSQHYTSGEFTCEFRITWFASSWIENFTPSSEENESIGESVPDVRTIVLTSFKSEKA